MTLKVLVSDKIPTVSLKVLDGFSVDVKIGLSEEELSSIIKNYSALIVRSKTKVTPKIIEAGTRLKVIGRAGVGVDNIAMKVAQSKNIVVVNSPSGNTVAAAEHTLALILSVARHIPFAHDSMLRGEWDRSRFLGVELRGKTLGIIGVGQIGKLVAKYTNAIGMNVIGYDPYIKKGSVENIEICDFEAVLRNSDFLTFHVPKTAETTKLVGEKQFLLMKTGVYIVNCARGGVIVEKDLKKAVENGKVAGAAVDVFCNEPVKDCQNILVGVPGIITTPHIGAATEDARLNVAVDVAEQVRDVLNGGIPRSPVIAPL